jgi:putative membrane protein
MQTLVAFLRTFGIGLLMGACDVVPGVSGGTIAFVTGVYQRLLGAIGGVDRTLRHHIRAGQRSAARAHVDG